MYPVRCKRQLIGGSLFTVGCNPCSVDTSVVIANALVSSCLDYCNSLFRSLSSRNATRLQYVQNALAQFVTSAPN